MLSLEAIRARPQQGDLFATLTALLRLHPEAQPPGGRGSPAAEILRLRPTLSLGFPSSDLTAISDCRIGRDGSGLQLDISSFGLYGPASPLPTYYTERLIAAGVEAGTGDSLLRGFIDILNHRLLSLLYRAWQKYRHSVQSPGPASLDHRLRLALGPDGQAHRGREAAIGLLGLLRRRPGTAAGLAALLKAHFPAIRVAVESCLLRYSRLQPEQRLRLGHASGRLGRGAVLGSRIANRSLTFGIELGPMSASQLGGLLPGGEAHAQLHDLIERCNTDLLDWECVLLVSPEQLSPARLDGQASLARGARLSGARSRPYRIVLRSPAREE